MESRNLKHFVNFDRFERKREVSTDSSLPGTRHDSASPLDLRKLRKAACRRGRIDGGSGLQISARCRLCPDLSRQIRILWHSIALCLTDTELPVCRSRLGATLQRCPPPQRPLRGAWSAPAAGVRHVERRSNRRIRTSANSSIRGSFSGRTCSGFQCFR